MDNSPVRQWATMTLSEESIQSLCRCYARAEQIGVNTALYLRKVAENGRIEMRIVQGSKALLRLARLFGNEKVERACCRALEGSKYNYETIKSIITTGLADIPVEHSQAPTDPQNTQAPHPNLRGADFFANKLNQ